MTATETRPPLSRRRFLIFSLVAASLALLVGAALLLAADLYLHHRAERSAGLNRWGYRGPVAPRKPAGEVRVAMLGGSTTFGYGVHWNESVPALLEEELRQRGGARFRTINLGFNNEGAFASVPTLEDYAWLDYDIVALYHGYNDLLADASPNNAVFRHQSPVFRLTGYFPILPLALQEKAMAIRSGGDLEAAYKAARDGQPARVTFKPNVAQRTSAAALEALSKATQAVGNQLDGVAAKGSSASATNEAGCDSPWTHFCDSVYRAVKYARGRGVGVMVIAQPGTGEVWAKLDEQRAQLQSMVSRRFGGDPGVTFVDMSRVVDPANPAVGFDGLHLNTDGNRIVARALVDPVLALTKNIGK